MSCSSVVPSFKFVFLVKRVLLGSFRGGVDGLGGVRSSSLLPDPDAPPSWKLDCGGACDALGVGLGLDFVLGCVGRCGLGCNSVVVGWLDEAIGKGCCVAPALGW